MSWTPRCLRDLLRPLDFSTTDYNVGAADYLDRNASIAAGVVEATDDYAILRVGARGTYL